MTDATDRRRELGDALRAWLPRQSWYRDRDRGPGLREAEAGEDPLALLALTEGDPAMVILLTREGCPDQHSVDSYPSTGRCLYSLPLAWCDEPEQVAITPREDVLAIPGARLADAASEPRVMSDLLRMMAEDTDIDAGRDGTVVLRCERGTTLDVTLTPARLPESARNTSVVFGDDYVLKFFRRLTAGPNPQIELVRALARRGNPAVPQLLGWGRAMLADGISYDLCVLQEFIVSGTDGWLLAAASARDLFSEGDLLPEDVGGDFFPEAYRLGETASRIHTDLALELGRATMDRPAVAHRIERAAAHATAACREVPGLARFEMRLLEAYEAAAAHVEAIPVQRIHGSLGLHEVLRTDRGWVVIDFEGDPHASVAERSRLRSPMNDVAGTLRSLDYSARHLLVGMRGDARLEHRVREWVRRNREAFLTGYRSRRPTSPSEDTMLAIFELDKAVSDAVRESRYRPGWLSVPLTFLSERLES